MLSRCVPVEPALPAAPAAPVAGRALKALGALRRFVEFRNEPADVPPADELFAPFSVPPGVFVVVAAPPTAPLTPPVAGPKSGFDVVL